MRILFVCTANRLRSATAETVFHGVNGVEAIGAGTDKDAPTTVSGDLIEWADVIVVMENMHRNKVSKKFRPLLKDKRLIVLGIPDDYGYMQPELITLLKNRVSRILRV